MTRRAVFAGVFIAACAVVGLATLALNPPGSKPEAAVPPAPPAPTASVVPPTTVAGLWPERKLRGAGGTGRRPGRARATSWSRRLTPSIGPEVSNPAMRFAGNNLSCQDCHLNAGTVRSGLPLVGSSEVSVGFARRQAHGHHAGPPQRVHDAFVGWQAVAQQLARDERPHGLHEIHWRPASEPNQSMPRRPCRPTPRAAPRSCQGLRDLPP